MIERLLEVAVYLSTHNRKLKVAHVNPLDFWTEARRLAAKVVLGDPYRAIEAEHMTVNTAAGDVDVFSNPDVMPGTVFCPREANEP